MNTTTKPRTHLYIDGQNFIRRIREVLRRRQVRDVDITKYDFWGLLNHIFRTVQIDLASFYMARILPHEQTSEKSEELITREHDLKAHLERQGFRYVTGGVVRSRIKAGEVTFEEKGVDVTIAVEMTRDICDKIVGTVVLASSDSDMQPVVRVAKERGVEAVYVGFRQRYNKGLQLTASRSILVSNEDVARYYPAAPSTTSPGTNRPPLRPQGGTERPRG
ncbi:NYN domain-containing protein [Candidatus Berkelbacteria bacterium]|nr:NYN domain-containing protein [Candidatus Berkelbacteria bacterium]